MKLVIATPLYPPEIGGPAIYAKELFEHLSAAGHAVTLVPFAEVRSLPIFLRHLVYGWRVLRAAARADAVIGFDTWSTGVPATIAAKLARKKLLVRIGGDVLWETFLERTHALVRLSDFYRTEPALSIKERLIRAGTRFVVRRADALVFNTQWQRVLWQRAYGFPLGKTSVIENEFPYERAPAPPHGTVFVAAARPRFLKNAETLRAAFETVRRTFPHATLDTQVLPPAEHAARIREAYAVIIPSVSDVSPNMAVDAIRYGKPCILPEDTGARERLDGVCSFVDTRDAAALAAAIKALLDPASYARAVERVRAFPFSHSWDDIVREFLAILEPLGASAARASRL